MVPDKSCCHFLKKGPTSEITPLKIQIVQSFPKKSITNIFFQFHWAFYRPQHWLRKGYILIGVCLSTGRVQPRGRHSPLARHPPPPGRHPTGRQTPLPPADISRQTPQGKHPLLRWPLQRMVRILL